MTEPIASYGLLGDTRTAALVSERGSLDWMCVPRFDGEPLFGALVDPERGGRWSIRPVDGVVTERAYVDRAASIETTWRTPRGTVVVREGMIGDASSRLVPRTMVVRHVRCADGEARIETTYDPRLGLPGRPPDRTRFAGRRITTSWGTTAVSLEWDASFEIEPGRPCALDMRAGESACFVLGLAQREPLTFVPPRLALEHLAQDDAWWREWTTRFSCEGPHERNVIRSLITLRLLTYAPSGAAVAAPTTSLPAPLASTHNWDYRFAWPRDASIGVGAFLAFGSDEEPRAFLEWFINASRVTRPRLDVLYDVDGRPVRHEREVRDVAGYADSTPVRVGNAAARQHQLDVYGWVLDAAWLMHSRGHTLARPHWRALRDFAGLLAAEWRSPDSGIWETRGEPKHYVHSKLMAWTGLDRALRLSASYPAGRRAVRWRAERDALEAEVRGRGFDEGSNGYRRVFDEDGVDGSLLVLPVLEFEHDPARLDGTIDTIRKSLTAGGALLYRYHPTDGVREGAFLPCSFWLVQALARTGRVREAEEAFDELCALATPLDLYAEQIDPSTRAHIGNFPQAFTHATFLQAAAALSEARETFRESARTARAPRDRRAASGRRS